MKLEQLLSVLAPLRTIGSGDAEIASIGFDSRTVEAGQLFFAVRGNASDGHDYIDAAIARGAAGIVCERLPARTADSVTYVQVADSSAALGRAASEFYGRPSEKLRLVGVTGTNGKTTTATLLYDLFRGLGYKVGLISTVIYRIDTEERPSTHTTPDSVRLNAMLAEMVARGCEYCFMEVSSIGLEQDRVAGLEFRAGIFSNLTHDHLDYHKTFAEYLRCKKLFFDNLPDNAYAITNIDDRNGMVMVQNTRAHIVTCSCRSIADHNARVLEESFDGMQLKIDGKETWTSLIGMHNAYNILAVYATAVTLGTDPDEALIAISRLRPAPGRLENHRGPHGLSVVIDYAHTPDALENVLRTLREIAPSRTLICVFGCGGDRDRSKRPEMGAIAEKMADRIIVTSDNSRTENTADIMADIRGGMSASGAAGSLFIEDREQAIRTAIMTAPENATILLAGKGHETYQIIGREKRHFDEKEIVEGIFSTMK